MIRVNRQVEPDDFDERVRQPGLAGLQQGRLPTDPRMDYWTRCLPELWRRYNKICAYWCIYIHAAEGSRTVDHFKPKSIPRWYKLAYEWDNYRLASRLANTYKGDSEKILDPFEVQDGWFHLQFPECRVSPDPTLTGATRQRVEATIDRLKLNCPELIDRRQQDFEEFLKRRDMTRTDLERTSPFLAREITRQNWRQTR